MLIKIKFSRKLFEKILSWLSWEGRDLQTFLEGRKGKKSMCPKVFVLISKFWTELCIFHEEWMGNHCFVSISNSDVFFNYRFSHVNFLSLCIVQTRCKTEEENFYVQNLSKRYSFSNKKESSDMWTFYTNVSVNP